MISQPVHQSRLGLLALATAAMLGSTSAVSATTWDITTQFSQLNGNPNGAWAYGWVDTFGGEFTLFPYPSTPPAIPLWSGPNGATIWKNIGEPQYGVPTNNVSLHPGGGEQPCIARWTAPAGVSGTVTVTGRFLSGDSGTMQVAVRHGGGSVWSATNSGEFNLQLAVTPGDTIDFAVFGGYFYGNTPLEVVIQGAPLCTPDFNGDGMVDGADLGTLLGAWGSCSGCVADLNGDSLVDGADLGALLGAWGPC